MKNGKLKIKYLITSLFIASVLSVSIIAQENPPAPAAPKAVSVPAVREKKLANGLTVAVIEKKNVPLVTVQLLVKSGAENEADRKAGLANMTAALLTKGTKTRTATQVAEQMEFLGGSINTGAGWNSSVVIVSVMADKLDQALAIMADVAQNPVFAQSEINLLKTQTLDGLTYNLKQPGFLANYVASRYSFDEHPAGGTPESLKSITRSDAVKFHRDNYKPAESVLIFTGDITPLRANALAQKFFGKWAKPARRQRTEIIQMMTELPRDEMPVGSPLAKRILVVDLPDSGQAAVGFTSKVFSGRGSRTEDGGVGVDENYFPAIVLNSLLGGGYSSRLNQEIRIKRGLSYGAGSSFGWRQFDTNFATRTQTKNDSAAEVAELVLAEVKKLSDGAIADVELNPRKSVLTGGFGRNLETTEGLAAAVADLYSFDLPASELNRYTKNVQTVTDAQIRRFAGENLNGGDIIIVGDYAKFKDDLTKRFPGVKIEVVSATKLDLSRDDLQKR